MPEWLDYEKQIHEKFCIYFPTCKVIHDTSIRGRYSKARRQVDVLIQARLEDFELRGIVECKYFNKRIDVKIVDYFIGFLDDVDAQFGYLITNKGFTKAAINRANIPHIRLRVIEFSHLDDIRHDIDDLINQNIKSLDCIEAVFMIRQQQRSRQVNLELTSLAEKTLTFKEGFADHAYFAHKKLLEETARVFRDFPCIGTIKVNIPSALEKTVYTTQIHIAELEAFLQVNFLDMRKDISAWRALLGTIKKPLVQIFAEKFVSSEAYTTSTAL